MAARAQRHRGRKEEGAPGHSAQHMPAPSPPANNQLIGLVCGAQGTHGAKKSGFSIAKVVVSEEEMQYVKAALKKVTMIVINIQGGRGLQGEKKAENRTRQSLVAAIAEGAKGGAIAADDPRMGAKERRGGKDPYYYTKFTTDDVGVASLLGGYQSARMDVEHTRYYIEGGEEKESRGQKATVIVAREEDFFAIGGTNPDAGVRAKDFVPDDPREVSVTVRFRFEHVLPLEANSVGKLVAAAIAYTVDEHVRNCRDVLIHGAQGAPFGTWNAEVSEVRHNHETTGAGGGAKQMSHGFRATVSLQWSGAVETMDRCTLALPLKVVMPTSVDVDGVTVGLPPTERWEEVAASWEGVETRKGQLMAMEGVEGFEGRDTPGPQVYLVLGGADGVRLLTEAAEAGAGGVTVAERTPSAMQGALSGGHGKSGAQRRMAVKDSQVAEELVQMVQAALVTAQGPRGNTAACRAACARLAREEREAAGRGRAQIDSSALAELLQKAEVSASGRGAKLALKTGAWEAHICKAEAGDGCAMQREPCQTFHGMELAFQHEQRQVQWRQARSPQRLPMEMAGPGRPGRAAVASTLWDLPGVAEEFQGRYAPPGQAEELFDFAQRRERERRQPPEMRVEAGAEGERGGRGKGGKARGRNEEEGGGGGGAAGEVPEEAVMDMEAQYEEIRAQEGEEEQGGGSGTNTPRKQPRQGMAQSPGGGAGAPRETRGRAAGQAAEAARPMLMEDVARTEAERASAAQVIGLGEY